MIFKKNSKMYKKEEREFMKVDKTNAMRFLDKKKVEYKVHTYEHGVHDPVDGIHVANMLQQSEERVFKTLVLVTNTKEHIVCMIPVSMELDLKKCAKAAGVKSVSMLPLKDLTKITGYIRGGCSPLAMKKQFRTFINENCLEYETIYFSGGKIGMQIEMDPQILLNLIPVQVNTLV